MSLSNQLQNFYFASKCCLFLLILGGNAHAARWAKVVVDKAVVFSDAQMSSAIGYIRKGKKVRVGEVARNKGRLLPIIINKRVGYIEISTLNIANDVETMQTVTERAKGGMKTQKIFESSIGAYGGLYQFNYRDKDFKEPENSEPSEYFYGLGLVGYYQNLIRDYRLKVGFEVMRYSEDESSTTIYSVPFGYRVFKHEINQYSRFDIYATLILQPFIEARFSDEFILNGNGLGGGVDFEFVTEFDQKFNFHLEGNYSIVKQFGFDSGTDNAILDSITEVLQGYLLGYKILAKVTYNY